MQFVTYKTHKRIGYITLSRPEKRNALNDQVVSELKQAFQQAEQDEEAKVIVLKAEGDAFCAGADLAYLQQLQENSYYENLADSTHLKELFYQIYTLPKVVIASIQGHAIAGGSGLAAVCDYAFAVPEAKFGFTEVRIGFIPAIVMVFLLRKAGEQKAKDLLLSGRLISAKQAKKYGIITNLAEGNLVQEVEDFAQELIEKNSAQSMAATKQMIAHVQHLTLEEALDYAAAQNAKARATEDCKKGIESFLKKEPVQW
ncbi:MAG: enoyl-CoA hydratase/isomerase family protein [Cyclobacteriaceae bacterium]|nr:enoyl-CoA hydratase/isomerase family protein [Cyclobacteriaceae bacterium]